MNSFIERWTIFRVPSAASLATVRLPSARTTGRNRSPSLAAIAAKTALTGAITCPSSLAGGGRPVPLGIGCIGVT